jgi:hypothetical protein
MPGFNLTHRSDEKRIIDLPRNQFLFAPSPDESDNQKATMKKLSALIPPIGIIAVLLLSSCAVQESTMPSGAVARSESAPAQFAQPPSDRPGLGTKWGETRSSRVGFSQFERANRTHPIASAAIYYNDAEGIRGMVGAVGWRRGWSILPAPVESLISIGLKDQSGRFLQA